MKEFWNEYGDVIVIILIILAVVLVVASVIIFVPSLHVDYEITTDLCSDPVRVEGYSFCDGSIKGLIGNKRVFLDYDEWYCIEKIFYLKPSFFQEWTSFSTS